MIRKKPTPDLIRGRIRFSEKITTPAEHAKLAATPPITV
jgi:hypothetical protein